MQLLIKILTIFCVLLFNNKLFSQTTEKVKTNVDLSYIKPKWMDSDLKSTTFRNGEPILQVYSIAEWKDKSKLSNPSLLYINKTDSGDFYYYNWFAISNEKNIAPTGYKIPSLKDLNESKNNKIKFLLTNKKNIDSFKYSDVITFQLSGYIDINLPTLNFDDTTAQLWLIDVDPKGFTKQFKVHKNQTIPTAANKSFGFPVRCIENIDETLKNNTYSYEKLLPKVFDSLHRVFDNIYKELYYNLIHEKKIKRNYNFKANSEIKFSNSGVNISDNFKIYSSNRKNETDNLLINKLNSCLKNWTVYPYYNDIKISSSSPVILDFNLKKNTEALVIGKNKFRQFNGLDKIENLISKSKKSKFYCNKTSIYSAQIDNSNKLLYSTTKSLKGHGPVYAFYSILPGMGFSSVRKTKFKFWIVSLPIGLISGISYATSNYYYSKYKTSNFKEDNYKIANTANKIFLSSAALYGVLALTDFSFTFILGTKNKILQHKINKEIKKYPKGLELIVE